jgi:hypothetical protein
MANVPVQLQEDGPIIEMDEAELVRRIGAHEDEDERVDWVEYRLRSAPKDSRPVHRSVHVRLKKTPSLFGETGSFT